MATLKNTTINDTGYIRIASGTTAQRPGSPEAGMIRFNTDLGYDEWYNGSNWYRQGNLPLFVTATGGTITTSGDYKIHTFTSSGTFTVSCAGNADGSNTVDYMVVAGGGGTGYTQSGDGAGGGGAGGFRESVPTPAAWTASPLANPGGSLPVTATGYPITVGSGGAALGAPENASAGNPGNPSVFSTITSAGGGGGGASRPPTVGSPGGSGGGGGGWYSPGGGGSGNQPPVSPPQGNNGGASVPSCGPGAGGGGATGTGSIPAGGTGATTQISGSPVTKSTGGGATAPAPSAGAANSGDGGTLKFDTAPRSTAGGSGIVVIRYKFQ